MSFLFLNLALVAGCIGFYIVLKKPYLIWRLKTALHGYTTASGHTKESGIIPLLILGGVLAATLGWEFIKGKLGCTNIECAGLQIGYWFVALLFGGLATAMEYIYKGVSAVLGWALQNLLSIPVAPGSPGVVQIVNDGWEVSRTLVNSLFLLILVFIGLSMILRLGEYGSKKMLVNLILIVLLVNFSGVLVGFVVDIANLLTNFFLGAVSDIKWDMPWAGKKDVTGSDITELIALSIGKILYYFVASFIFLGVIAVFFVRLFVLWTLAILAPLAFAAFILPATRRFWNQWFSTLIQWAFVGVPMSFFLYLAGLVLSLSAQSKFNVVSPTAAVGAGAFASFLAPFTALFLLFAGITISLSLAPAFAQKIGGFAKGAAMVTTGVLARDVIRDNLARSGRMQRLTERMEKFGSNRTGVAGTLLRAGSAPTRWAGRKMGSEAQAGIKEDTTKAEAEAKDWSAAETASKLKGNVPWKKKLGWLNAKIKAGEIDDVIAASFKEPQIRAVYDQARTVGQHQDLQAAFPHFVEEQELQQSHAARTLGIRPNRVTAAQAAAVTPGEVAQERGRIYSRMKPERVKQMSAGALRDPDAAEGILRGFNGARFGNLASSDQGQEAVQNLEDRLQALATAGASAIPAADPEVVTIIGTPAIPAIPAVPATPGRPLLGIPPTPAIPGTPGTAATGLLAQGVSLAEATRRARMRVWLIRNGKNAPLARHLQGQAGQNLGLHL